MYEGLIDENIRLFVGAAVLLTVAFAGGLTGCFACKLVSWVTRAVRR